MTITLDHTQMGRMHNSAAHRWGTPEWVLTDTQRIVPVDVPSGGKNLGLGFTQNQEMYRVLVSHTHAYEEWHVEMVTAQRQARARNGLLNYDCHSCKSTVLLAQDAMRCTDCNGML